MSLRELAVADAHAIATDESAFGWPITVTDPAGTSATLTGLSNDISQVIDPETGQVISGRSATVVVSLVALAEAGLGIPKGVTNKAVKPWVVVFAEPGGGVTHTFKVSQTMPDRTIGLVVCVLEGYTP